MKNKAEFQNCFLVFCAAPAYLTSGRSCRSKNIWRARQRLGSFSAIWRFASTSMRKSNVTVRVMAANLNGDTQSYQPFAIRIFQGLKPDIVAIQEFNYSNNTAFRFSRDGGHRFRNEFCILPRALHRQR